MLFVFFFNPSSMHSPSESLQADILMMLGLQTPIQKAPTKMQLSVLHCAPILPSHKIWRGETIPLLRSSLVQSSWLQWQKIQEVLKEVSKAPDPTYEMSVLDIKKKMQLLNIMTLIKMSYCTETSVAFAAT